MYGLGQLPQGGMRDFRRGGGGRRGNNSYALILAMKLIHQISQLRRKPPLTLALMAGMSALHLKPDLFEGLLAVGNGIFDWGWLAGGFDLVRSVCLHPASMFDTFERTGGLEIRRLLISPFVHDSDTHLYYNMASFLLKGVTLELTMGTHAFAGLLAYSLLASQLMMVLAAWVLLVVFDVSSPMHTCTVGFSGVLFALNYVLSRRFPGTQTVLGFQVNTRYATWLELVLIYFMVPNASFLGHLCGILAGILYVEVPTIISLLDLVTGVTLARGSRGPSYTYSSGTSSGPPSGRDSGNGRRATVTRRSGAEPQHEQPEPSSLYDVASDPDAEEAALQEALRRSLLDDSGSGGRDSERVSTSVRNSRGSAGEAAAAAENLGPAPPLPTAPPPEEPQQGHMSSDAQSGMTSSADAAAAVNQNEMRRRRLQRLGGGGDHIVL
ncbi:unnamed protein product [Pylaiella littoralis]